jgi:hypothetical protein
MLCWKFKHARLAFERKYVISDSLYWLTDWPTNHQLTIQVLSKPASAYRNNATVRVKSFKPSITAAFEPMFHVTFNS